MLLVGWILDLDLKLSHCANQGFRAVDQVLVYGVAVERELIICVAILVYNLHLLDDSALAAFSRTYSRNVSTNVRPVARACKKQAWSACEIAVDSLPSSNILHSRRSFFESSSSPRSIIWLRFF